MKTSYLHLAVTTLALALLFAFAAPSATAEENSGPVTKVIKSVDTTANTVEIQITRGDKTISKTFTVDATTAIEVNEDKATLAQVKPGMVVKNMTARQPEDSHILDRLSLTGTR
jgi:thiamine monophosphate kinase